MVRLRFVAGVVAMALAAVGCGDERPVDLKSTSSPPTSADQAHVPVQTPTTRVVGDCAYPGCLAIGWSDFIHTSVGAVVGTVESVTGPRWNQESGEQWDGDAENHPGNPYALQMQYRDAVLQVEDVLFRDPGETFAAGERITVRLLGDGTPTGVEVDGVHINEIVGPVPVGSRVLWVLDRAEFHWKERVEYPLGLASFLGNWRIEGDTAVNRWPERTVPVEALRGAIKREANSPRRPGDLRGSENPLE
jgi:hypothetical protein